MSGKVVTMVTYWIIFGRKQVKTESYHGNNRFRRGKVTIATTCLRQECYHGNGRSKTRKVGTQQHVYGRKVIMITIGLGPERYHGNNRPRTRK